MMTPENTAPVPETAGQRIRSIRKAKGLTQIQMADALCIGQGLLSGFENDRKPITKRLKKMFRYEYGVNEEWLSNGSGDCYPKIDLKFVAADESYRPLNGAKQNVPVARDPEGESAYRYLGNDPDARIARMRPPYPRVIVHYIPGPVEEGMSCQSKESGTEEHGVGAVHADHHEVGGQVLRGLQGSTPAFREAIEALIAQFAGAALKANYPFGLEVLLDGSLFLSCECHDGSSQTPTHGPVVPGKGVERAVDLGDARDVEPPKT